MVLFFLPGQARPLLGEMQLPIAAPPLALWVNFQTASNVIGQVNFTTNSAGTTLDKFNNSRHAVVDPATGKIFVADHNNHRVLRFTSTAAMMNGATAEIQFGVTGSAGASATQFNQPLHLAMDAGGRLWVADFGNSRVLRFENAATALTGAPPNGVLGQPGFTTGGGSLTANGMPNPWGISIDTAGRLWVADRNFHRVLRFDNAAAKANGGAADGVLGQPNFTTATPATSQSGMREAIGVFADAGGRVWVSDFVNRRVLRFDNAAAKANGANADGVLGQTDFITGTGGVSATKVNPPIGLHGDSFGRLYVADYSNNRVLIFNDAATLANGAAASNVLGQPDFTSNAGNNGGLTASALNVPYGIFFDEATGSLFVSDANNNRVLRFFPAGPSAASVTVGGRVMVGNGRGLANARVYLTEQNGEVRMAMTSSFGYFRFADIAAGQSVIIRIVWKRYQFEPQVVNVFENIEDLNFYAEF